MENAMIFTILFGGISIALFILASALSTPPTEASVEKPHKVVVYTYILAVVFIIIAITIFLVSSLTFGDLVNTIREL